MKENASGIVQQGPKQENICLRALATTIPVIQLK